MSEPNETVAQKLRRWAREAKNARDYPSFVAHRETFNERCVVGCDEESKLFERLADMVEEEEESFFARFASSIGKPMRKDEDVATWFDRWYLPRPVFEDGEPAEIGDWFEVKDGTSEQIAGFGPQMSSLMRIRCMTGELYDVSYSELLKRPKMLDADGVPIEVGDTVWGVNYGEKYVVAAFDKHGFIDQCGFMHPPEVYTHREPDSLEKLRNDIAEWRACYTIPETEWGIEMMRWCDRLEVLIERGA